MVSNEARARSQRMTEAAAARIAELEDQVERQQRALRSAPQCQWQCDTMQSAPHICTFATAAKQSVSHLLHHQLRNHLSNVAQSTLQIAYTLDETFISVPTTQLLSVLPVTEHSARVRMLLCDLSLSTLAATLLPGKVDTLFAAGKSVLSPMLPQPLSAVYTQQFISIIHTQSDFV